ncbi:MAG: hypothetical protein ABW133_01875 [Polyangiaceae bacterium]
MATPSGPPGAPPAQPPAYGPLPPYGQPAPYYPGAAPVPYGAPAPPAVPPDARSHSGFFLRMAVGGGYLANSSTLTGGSYQGGVDATGGAVGLELSIGGALSPGIILAGSYSFQTVGNANLKNDTRSVRSPHDPTFTLLGVMLDVYPNAKGGFHLGGALGLAAVTIREVDDTMPKPSAQNGIGIAPHIGYEWWVGNYWGLGVLGKLLLARSEGDYGNSTEKNTVIGGAIMFSATYN